MHPLPTLFRSILSGLLATIAALAAKDRARTAFLVRLYGHYNRAIQRFEKLFAQWRANTLPPQRHRPNQKPRPRTTPPLPTARHWLTRTLASTEANLRAYQLDLLLASEDCAQFLAAVPRAGRILRPLARAFGLHMPGDPPPPLPKSSFTPDPPPRPWPPPLGIEILRPAWPLPLRPPKRA
jgi:hypothetical protein